MDYWWRVYPFGMFWSRVSAEGTAEVEIGRVVLIESAVLQPGNRRAVRLHYVPVGKPRPAAYMICDADLVRFEPVPDKVRASVDL